MEHEQTAPVARSLADRFGSVKLELVAVIGGPALNTRYE